MNSKKKQTVAVAMATALGASAMMSPVAVHALEEGPATAVTQESNQQDSTQEVKPQDDTTVSEQGLPASEQPQELNTNSLSSGKPIIQSRTNVAFTDFNEAKQAIETALAGYPVSNATTRQEILDFLKKEFVVTGKLGGINVILNNIPATPDSTGTIEIGVALSPVVAGSQFPNNRNFTSYLIIPRIPKAGEVAIDKANFPDDTFRKYVKDNLDRDNPKDGVLSQDEISKITNIEITNNSNVKSLKGIEHFTALMRLNCYNTGIDSLDVNNNTALEFLDCSRTGIGTLDVSKNLILDSLNCSNTEIGTLVVSNNPNLKFLVCNDTRIGSLDISNNTDLTTLGCYNTGIQTLNVSNNHELTYLDCFNTGIKTLDVSNNPNLWYLNCYDTGIGTLDVSNNTDLKYLYCHNTGIQTLDVSNNPALISLSCYNTGIGSLDVSNNTALTYLTCSNTPLAWLKLGVHSSLAIIDKSSSVVDLAVTGDSFDMAQAFAGIDISKVTNIHGATLNGNSITGYTLGTPIIYTYDCGNDVYGNSVTLDVTLNLVKSDSDIQITGTLDTTYTGKPIVNPSVISTGSKGTVTFTYEKWDGTGWEVFSEIPTDAGKYRIQAQLASDDYYNEAVSEKEFTITQATNSWKNEPAIANWTYGRQPNSPTATAKFGNPIFTYSDSKVGTFTSDVPVNAGTWYVKATVAGTNNYTGLESIHAFTILPKNIKDGNITVSDINSDNDVKKLSVKDDDRELVKGTDYDVETKKAVNKTIVTITFKGNYAGTIERTYTVETSQPEKPEQKPQQGNPQEKPKDTGSVKTGDSTQTGLLATLSMLSAGCIAFLAGKKRKMNIKEDESTPL